MARIAQNPRFFAAVSIAALAGACAPDGVEAAKSEDAQTAQQPPAPEGSVQLDVETLADGLVNPWSLAFLPDGTILVTERAGRIRVIRDGALVEAPVAGTPEPYVANQAGYFDILPHPDFLNNSMIFLAYAHGDREENATRVISAKFDGAALSDVTTVWEAAPKKSGPVHFGGRLAMAPDGALMITTGDGFDYREEAQKLENAFGKTVRITLSGEPAAGDVFADEDGALPEVWTYGHRNVQGLGVDSETGVIYANEHGPKGGDELNILDGGSNYGWPLASYGVDYSGAKVTPYTVYEGTVQPIKYWTPSIGISGLTVYRADLFADWQGDILVGALAERSLHRIDMDNGKPIAEERYLVGERIRDVRVGPDGAIYVTTEDRQGAPVGKVLRLTPQ